MFNIHKHLHLPLFLCVYIARQRNICHRTITGIWIEYSRICDVWNEPYIGSTIKKGGRGGEPRFNVHLSRIPDRALVQEAIVLYIAWYVRIWNTLRPRYSGQEIVVRPGGIQRVTPQVTGIWASHSVGTTRVASLFPCRILMNPYISWTLRYANLAIDASGSKWEITDFSDSFLII